MVSAHVLARTGLRVDVLLDTKVHLHTYRGGPVLDAVGAKRPRRRLLTR